MSQTTRTPPDRTPQHLSALERATETRLARAETKRWIRATSTTAESVDRAIEVLKDLPEHMKSMPVHAFLATIRRYGNGRASELLGRIQIAEHRQLGTLNRRQIGLVVGQLRGDDKQLTAFDIGWEAA